MTKSKTLTIKYAFNTLTITPAGTELINIGIKNGISNNTYTLLEPSEAQQVIDHLTAWVKDVKQHQKQQA